MVESKKKSCNCKARGNGQAFVKITKFEDGVEVRANNVNLVDTLYMLSMGLKAAADKSGLPLSVIVETVRTGLLSAERETAQGSLAEAILQKIFEKVFKED